MSSNLRFIVISTILCGGALCRRDDALQAYTYPLEQPPSGERQDSGAPSPLAQLDDKSSQVTDNDSSLAIFEKRILPIFQSDMPSSCAECHLSGVDLKEYIRPT